MHIRILRVKNSIRLLASLCIQGPDDPDPWFSWILIIGIAGSGNCVGV